MPQMNGWPAGLLDDEPEEELTLGQKVERIEALLIARARGEHEGSDAREYEKLREALRQAPDVGPALPSFLTSYRTLDQFWGFISSGEFSGKISGAYRRRTEFIYEQLRPVFEVLEGKTTSPSDDVISAVLANPTRKHVHRAWKEALERRYSKPDGAITMARSTLEAACKAILHESGTSYPDDAKLPKLYSLVAEKVGLHPGNKKERALVQMCSGLFQVVNAIAEIRNKEGDAHGKSPEDEVPPVETAEAVVNAAGTLATLLISRWDDLRGRPDEGS